MWKSKQYNYCTKRRHPSSCLLHINTVQLGFNWPKQPHTQSHAKHFRSAFFFFLWCYLHLYAHYYRVWQNVRSRAHSHIRWNVTGEYSLFTATRKLKKWSSHNFIGKFNKKITYPTETGPVINKLDEKWIFINKNDFSFVLN